MANILVAGSDSAETQAQALLLEFAGHQCATADSWSEAEEILRQCSIDLVVSQGNVYGKRPIEILSNLKMVSPETAWMMLADEEELVWEGEANEVLPTPCTLDDLLLGVQNALGHSTPDFVMEFPMKLA